ncbi:MAG TPA: FMN-binding protein [Actinotalea sp.]|jgi:uncharacterized protein with FMN-binding domain
MRRIVIAIGTTLSGVVLLFAYPTSLNRIVGTSTVAAAPATTGTGTTGTGTSGTTSGSSATSGTAQSGATTAPSATASTQQSTTATYTGAAASTRYGNVQVQITVTDGKITDAVTVDYPSQNGHDQQINAYALPILQSETVQAQSSSVDMVSGATYTSHGYITSLQSAIDQAGL